MGTMLKDKVAVVTGSGRGIGKGIAMLLAEEGAKVVVNDPGVGLNGSGLSHEPADEVVREIQGHGGVAVANYDTVATMDGGQSIVQAAIDSFGRIDILVNNAGVHWMASFVKMTEQDFDTLLQVNLKGHFTCTKAAVPHMIAQRSGRIINMASGAALGPAGVGAIHYATAKAGVLGFTRSLAHELGRRGITVNALMPAAGTRMIDAVPGPKLVLAEGIAQTPEDVAPIVAFLASDQAANINGATFAARLTGVIQLMSDPVAVKSIYKAGRWTVAELAELIPKTLGQGLVNPAPARTAE